MARDEALQKYSLVIARICAAIGISSMVTCRPPWREINEAVSRALDVQRVSVWFYNEERDQIQCANLFETGKGHTSSGI